jgi:uncharacterized membrane protein
MQLLFTWIDLLRSEFHILGAFWWMAWNAMLAIIPVVLAVVFFKREDQPRRGLRTFTFFFEIVLVLLLLPNAPYIATDLIHFLETVRLSDVSLWKLLGTEFPLYVAFVLFGLLCYAFTTDRLLYALRMRLGRTWYRVGLFGIPLLSSVGIYLGRVARFNSWDILSTPVAIIHSSRSAFDSFRVIKVVVSMWFLLLIIHQVYKVFHDGLRVRYEEYHKSKNPLLFKDGVEGWLKTARRQPPPAPSLKRRG